MISIAKIRVAGEISELTKLINCRSKFQEIREHICEIMENIFRLFHIQTMRNTRKLTHREKTESTELQGLIMFHCYSLKY